MDISEIWNSLGYLVAPVVILGIAYLELRIANRLVRFAAVAVSLTLFALAVLTLVSQGFLLFDGTSRRPNANSPDGKHVAVTTWLLSHGDECDHAYVAVRSHFSPVGTGVFYGCASHPPIDPDVRWLDNSSLLISYSAKSQIKPCPNVPKYTGGIHVLCQQ
jgi:hypothetical protein